MQGWGKMLSMSELFILEAEQQTEMNRPNCSTLFSRALKREPWNTLTQNGGKQMPTEKDQINENDLRWRHYLDNRSHAYNSNLLAWWISKRFGEREKKKGRSYSCASTLFDKLKKNWNSLDLFTEPPYSVISAVLLRRGVVFSHLPIRLETHCSRRDTVLMELKYVGSH